MKNGTCINISLKQALGIKKAIWVDVRDGDEYKKWHFKNSINLPVDNIKQIIRKVKNKKRPIVVYCSKRN